MSNRAAEKPDNQCASPPVQLPSNLARQYVVRLKLPRGDWRYAFRLAQLTVAMEDYVAAADAFLSAPDNDAQLGMHILRHAVEHLGREFEEAHWARYLHDTYGRYARPKKDCQIRHIMFPGSYWDVWHGRLARVRAERPELIDQAGTHLYEVYVDCANAVAVMSAFLAGYAGRYELFCGTEAGARGLVDSIRSSAQHINGLPDGSSAGLLAELAAIRELIAESEWPDSLPEPRAAKKKSATSNKRKRAST